MPQQAQVNDLVSAAIKEVLRRKSQTGNSSLEMNLREQLLGRTGSSTSSSAYPPVPQTASGGSEHPYRSSDPTSPQDQENESGPSSGHQAGASYSMSNDSGADDGLTPEQRKGKRELSTSKRAAQHRAAQRAFRQRKEGYIRKLESQVDEYEIMEKHYKSLQTENYQLREYILNLQSRLLESQSEVPPPPVPVSLEQPAPTADSHARSAAAAAATASNPDSEMEEAEPASRQVYAYEASERKHSS